jgi:hypothetical protein
MDQKIYEYRLVSKESVIAQTTSLQKCAAKLSNFRNYSTPEHAKKSVETFLKEALLFNLDLHKSCRLLQSFSGHMKEYNEMEKIVNGQIQQANDEINQLKIRLNEEQEIRKHRLQCEVLASDVNQHPTTSSLKRKINELTQSFSSTNETIDGLENEIKIRKIQYDQLHAALLALESKLHHTGEDDDEEEENREDDPVDLEDEGNHGEDCDGNTSNNSNVQQTEEKEEENNPDNDDFDESTINTSGQKSGKLIYPK